MIRQSWLSLISTALNCRYRRRFVPSYVLKLKIAFVRKLHSLAALATGLIPNLTHVFFYSLIERKKRGGYLPPFGQVRTKIQWWSTLSPMPRRRSLRSSGALRDTRPLFPTYWPTCGSTFIGYSDWNHNRRFTRAKTNLRVFLGALHMWKVEINVTMFNLDVADACRLWL